MKFLGFCICICICICIWSELVRTLCRSPLLVLLVLCRPLLSLWLSGCIWSELTQHSAVWILLFTISQVIWYTTGRKEKQERWQNWGNCQDPQSQPCIEYWSNLSQGSSSITCFYTHCPGGVTVHQCLISRKVSLRYMTYLTILEMLRDATKSAAFDHVFPGKVVFRLIEKFWMFVFAYMHISDPLALGIIGSNADHK